MVYSEGKKVTENLIYLDYQATTPCDPRVVQTMLPYFSTNFANAHSDHKMGQKAAEAVEIARQQVADSLGVSAQEIIFTSGATESNNIALQGAVHYLLDNHHKARRVITVATEHKSVLETVQNLKSLGVEPFILPVQSDGLVDQDQLKAALQVPTLLVSIMAANNETGVLQDISSLSAIAHAYGALFHCDLAQAFGKTLKPFTIKAYDVDLASLSGHKIYGPKGIGVLYRRKKPRVRLRPLVYGGYQERGIRAGTLSVPLIVGMAKACVLLQQENPQETERLLQYKQTLLKGLKESIPDLKINGSFENSLAGCINLRLPVIKALDLLNRIPHLCLSTGSACNAAAAPSYVLSAMGLSEQEVFASFRLSFGRMTTQEEVEKTIHALSLAWHDAMVELN